jgi:hypothetical protein
VPTSRGSSLTNTCPRPCAQENTPADNDQRKKASALPDIFVRVTGTRRPRTTIPCPKRSQAPRYLPRSWRQRQADVATEDCGPMKHLRQRTRLNLGLAPVVPLARTIPPRKAIPRPTLSPSLAGKHRNLDLAHVPVARTMRPSTTIKDPKRSDTVSLRLKQRLPFDKRHHLTPFYRKAPRLKKSVWQSLWMRLH